MRQTHSQDFREKTEKDYDNIRASFVGSARPESAGKLQAYLAEMTARMKAVQEDLADLRRRAVLG